jgi:hypothetical protein
MALPDSQEFGNDDRGGGEGVKGLRVDKWEWRIIRHSQECGNEVWVIEIYQAQVVMNFDVPTFPRMWE